MGKTERKIAKLKDKIAFLEEQMYTNLKQKISNTAEISIAEHMRRIEVAKKELSLLENK